MTSDSDLQKLIEQEEAKARQSFERAVEAGGLPTETEISAVFDALNEAFDQIEAVWWRVRGIAELEGWPELQSGVPTVSFEQIGVVAVLADDIEERTESIEKFVPKLRGAIGTLDMIRRNQSEALEREAESHA